jgi:hypothetical protein
MEVAVNKPAVNAAVKPAPKPAADAAAVKAKKAAAAKADPKADMQAFIGANLADAAKTAKFLASESLLKQCREACARLEKRLRTERKNADSPKAEKGEPRHKAAPIALVDAKSVKGAPALGTADLKGYYKALRAEVDGKAKARK